MFRKASTADERASLAMALGLMRHRDAVPQTIEYLQNSNLATGRKYLAFGSLALGMHADPRGAPAEPKRASARSLVVFLSCPNISYCSAAKRSACAAS